jgi:hypothetical protein
MISKRFVVCGCLVLTTFLCEAQKTIVHTNYQWFQYFNQLKFSEKHTLFSDVSFRSVNNFNSLSQILLRTGFGYPVTPRIQGVTGVACFTFYNTESSMNRIEFRPFQDFVMNRSLGKTSVVHRLRTEARYFRTVTEGDITSQSSFNFRFRYRIFFMVPILKLSETHSDRRLLLNIGDEVFINAGKEIIYTAFDNNRFTLGSTVECSNKVSVALNYMFQYGHRNGPALYESSDIVVLAITHRMTVGKMRNTGVQRKEYSDD